jgi:5-(carboxyamino)imidazole ribonucleotide synthase
MMVKSITADPPVKIGIIGGGQLGKMTTQEAKKMGFHVTVLDPTPNCPAAQVADRHIIGEFGDAGVISELAAGVDIVTYEFEHINADVLRELEDGGHVIRPSAYTLKVIQNKLRQKDLLSTAGIPVPKYKRVETLEELMQFPAILKTCEGGYDGKGNYVIRDEGQARDAFRTLGAGKVELMVEKLVRFEKELAVMVASNPEGEIRCYPVVETIHRDNICHMTIAPARVGEDIQNKAREIAMKAMKVLRGAGVFGIEMFLENGEVMINEIAPRPHNSGHYTIEGCVTSQFEQHVRAITGLPLGSTELLAPAVMVNILGEGEQEGPAILDGIREALSIPGVTLHFYGKATTKPKRKMGHITAIDKDVEKAIEKANRARSFLRMVAR